MDIKKIKKFILEGNFAEARTLTLNFDPEDILNLMWSYSSKEEIGDKRIYDFICYCIEEEKNRKRLIKLHVLASYFLAVVVPFLPFSFKKAIFHSKKAVELNPEDFSLKENLLFIYRDPDAKEFMSTKEARKIAKEVLKKKSDSEEAKRTLEYIGKERKNTKKL